MFAAAKVRDEAAEAGNAPVKDYGFSTITRLNTHVSYVQLLDSSDVVYHKLTATRRTSRSSSSS